MSRVTMSWLGLVGGVAVIAAGAQAQQLGDQNLGRGPRFLLASASRAKPVRLDPSGTTVLRRQLSLRFDGTALKAALAEISTQAGLDLVYADDVLPATATVDLRAERITVAAALTDVLLNAGVDVVFTPDGRATLVRRPPVRQLGSIAGTVRDAATSAPLARATVLVVGTRTSAETDASGRYTLTGVAPGAHRLQARMLGYAAGDTVVDVPDGQEIVVNFQLRVSPFELSPVVAVGYGEQDKANLTGSVATAAGTEILKRPVAAVADALQGLAPGLTVIDRGGRPGDAGTFVFIRGRGTLNDQTPLLLVDGVRADMSNLTHLNADDVENISVLKDAASAAIYGARGANGVILVTTKRGANTGALKWSYDGYYGSQSVAHFPKRIGIRDYLTLINEARANAGEAQPYSAGYIDSTVMADRHVPGVDPLKYPDTDWLDVLWNPAPIQDHTLRLSGGTDLARFALSLSYMDQAGMLPNTAANRQGLRLNTDFAPNSRLRAGVDITLRRNWDLQPRDLGEALFRMFHDTPPTTVSKYPSEPATCPSPPATCIYGWSPNNRNPLAAAEASGRHTFNHLHATINTRADYQLLPGLALRGLASVYARSSRELDWQNLVVFRDYWNPTLIKRQYNPNFLWSTRTNELEAYLRGMAEYQGTRGDHAFGAMLGYEQTANDQEWTQGYRQNFYNNDVQQLRSGDPAVPRNDGTASAWRMRSGFGRLTYGWKGRYLFEANGRYDGSSRFAPGHRFGFFPSFSAAWRLSDEPFLRSVGDVGDLKLRGSWGRVGNNNVGNYPYWSLISLTQGYSFGDQLVIGAAQTTLANRDISWESTTMTDVGLDADLFKGRLSFTGDVYRKDTEGILYELAIPTLIGLNPSVQNVAKVRNSGWETAITYRAAAAGVNYSLGVNLTYNKNKVVSLRGTGPYFNDMFIIQAGLPIGTIFGLQADGLFRDSTEVVAHAYQTPLTGPGDIKFVDQNNDGVIDNKDRVPIGHDMPSYTVGATWTASYKGLDASVFWQGALDVDAYLEGALTEGPVWENYTTKEWLDHWTPTNLDAEMPRPRHQIHINHGPRSSFWVRDASYIKLKNAQIGYTLPAPVARRLNASSVRVYVSGQNLVTLAKVAFLLDPEFPSGRGTVYPQTRTVAFGASVQF